MDMSLTHENMYDIEYIFRIFSLEKFNLVLLKMSIKFHSSTNEFLHSYKIKCSNSLIGWREQNFRVYSGIFIGQVTRRLVNSNALWAKGKPDMHVRLFTGFRRYDKNPNCSELLNGYINRENKKMIQYFASFLVSKLAQSRFTKNSFRWPES